MMLLSIGGIIGQMKELISKKLLVVLLLIVCLMLVGCSASDPLTESIYFTNVYTDEINYSNPYWEELAVPAASMGSLLNAESAPATNCQSGFAFLFVDEALAVDEKIIYFTVEMPHDYAEGTDVIPCVHFVFGSDEVGTCVRWRIAYSWANIGEDFAPATTIWALSDPANNNSLEHQATKFAPVSGTGKEISSLLLCLVSRNSSNASDDFTGMVSLLGASILYQKDSPGSTSEWSK